MTIQIAAGVLVRDGRVLLGHRHPEREKDPDCWDAVGGHVEDGETTDDALIREVREELGIEVIAYARHPVEVAIAGLSVTTYVITDWRGTPTNTAPDEHDDLRWFSADAIADLHLAHPSMRRGLHSAARVSQSGRCVGSSRSPNGE